jgi:hypothetical protein
VLHNSKQSSQWHFKRQGEGATHVKVSALRIDVPFFLATKMHLLVVYAIKIRHTENIFFSKPLQRFTEW